MEDFALRKRKKQNGYSTRKSQKDVNRFCENICKEKFSLMSLNFRRTVDCFADLLSASLNDTLFYLYSPCHTHIHIIVYNYHYSYSM